MNINQKQEVWDTVDNAVHQALETVAQQELEWDMEMIGEVRDAIIEVLTEKGFIGEFEAYPWITQWYVVYHHTADSAALIIEAERGEDALQIAKGYYGATISRCPKIGCESTTWVLLAKHFDELEDILNNPYWLGFPYLLRKQLIDGDYHIWRA